jgi:hypothetical protein
MNQSKKTLSYCIRSRVDEDTERYTKKHYKSLLVCMRLSVKMDVTHSESITNAYMNKEAVHWILLQARLYAARLI